jgi:hypothetical protein
MVPSPRVFACSSKAGLFHFADFANQGGRAA